MLLSLNYLAILLIAALQLSGLFFFATGFFPKKIVMPGKATFQPSDQSRFPVPVFSKMIFVVIDAMRSDFVFSEASNMPFVHSLINSGNAIGFTAYSSPPTVTLPRLKGITTGSTPNFLDAILNIAESDTSSTLANQDSWIAQLKAQNKRIRMFGDDTWIKLFPGMFDETDGTASFFVSDFTEVDNNVTRHIDHQLQQSDDWDIIILHYLGLDHIGHKGGPLSPFMSVKQKEMDGVIEKLFSKTDDTLLVVMGDHGMNEAGNHGGSSAGETSPGLLLISDKFQSLPIKQKAPLPARNDFKYYNTITQADLVPTIAALFDFPIPLNSLGVFLKDLLPLWRNSEDQANVLKQNAYQIANILEASYPGFKTITVERQLFCESLIDIDDVPDQQNLECLWWNIQETFDNADSVYEFLDLAQRVLSKAASNYDEKNMFLGLTFSVLALTVSIVAASRFLRHVKPVFFVLLVITGLYAGAMFGSSLVEEEHHLWYWGATGWISWLYLLTARKNFVDGFYWVFSMITIRIIRSWNQTGQKYAGGPDIASFLLRPENVNFLWCLIVIYYGTLFGRVWKGSFSKLNPMFGIAISFITIASSFSFKTHMAYESGEIVPSILQKIVGIGRLDNDPTRLIGFARFSFFTIGFGAIYELSNLLIGVDTFAGVDRIKPITNISVFLEAFFVLQSKTANIPLFIVFNLLRSYMMKAVNQAFITRYTKEIENSKGVTPVSIKVTAVYTISILIFQHMAFFAMGNSNSLASVDLSNAYNGVSSYNVPVVGALTFISNWAGPLYWGFTGLTILLEDGYTKFVVEKLTAFRGFMILKNTKPDEIQRLTRLYLREVRSSCQEFIVQRTIITQLFFSGALAGIMGACIVLKDHLFIWTVFSPKLLYAAAWVGLQHFGVDVLVGTVISFLSY
jgi:ethanolaminephosphotransferase